MRLLLMFAFVVAGFGQNPDAAIQHFQLSNRAWIEGSSDPTVRALRIIEGELVLLYTENPDADAYIVTVTYEKANGARGSVTEGMVRPSRDKVITRFFEIGIVKVVNITATPTRISGPPSTMNGSAELSVPIGPS